MRKSMGQRIYPGTTAKKYPGYGAGARNGPEAGSRQIMLKTLTHK